MTARKPNIRVRMRNRAELKYCKIWFYVFDRDVNPMNMQKRHLPQ